MIEYASFFKKFIATSYSERGSLLNETTWKIIEGEASKPHFDMVLIGIINNNPRSACYILEKHPEWIERYLPRRWHLDCIREALKLVQFPENSMNQFNLLLQHLNMTTLVDDKEIKSQQEPFKSPVLK